MELILATRKSALAQTQTKRVMKLLKEKSGVDSKKFLVVPEGDKRLDVSLNKIGGKGLFTKEIEIALLENIQREDLNAIEEAQAYQTMMEKLKLTQNELAKRIGKSRTHITNILRLLNLPEKIQEYVLDGSLSMGHARALITLDKERALKIAKRVIDEKLSVRDVENIVKGFELQEARKNKPKVEKSKEYQYVEGLLRKKYRTRIKVDDKSITIKYSDTDDLNRLLELMGVIEES